MYHKDAVLDDPSVGRKFVGHQGVMDYFESYFIGYHTQTRLIHFHAQDDKVHLEVEFTGDLPEGKIGGLFILFLKKVK